MKATLVALALATALAPTMAVADWSIGTNLGITFISPDGGDGVTAVAIPGGVGGFQPGLRVGRALESPRHELFADTGLLLYSTESFSSNAFELTGNYQWNLAPDRDTGPYLTTGFGFLVQSVEVGSTRVGGTSAIFGFGVGLRRMIAERAGSVRAELRLDRVTEARDDGVVVVPDANLVSLKLGYDLWIRR
jgi:hypothetical protein